MKKLLLLSTMLLSAVSVRAEDNLIHPYVGVKLNNNFFDAEISGGGDSISADAYGLGGALALGFQVKDFRVELEGFYNQEVEDSYGFITGKATTGGFFTNLFYDIPFDTKIKPYVAAGLGQTWGKFKATYLGSADDNKMSWNVGAGLTYQLTEHTNFDVGYRYVDYGKFDIMEGEAKVHMRSHTITCGVRYTF